MFVYINCNRYAVVECPSLRFEMFWFSQVCVNGLDGFDCAMYMKMKEWWDAHQVSARHQAHGDMHHSFVYTARVVNKSAGCGSATSSEKRWTWHKTSSRMMHYATFCLIVAGQNISGRSWWGACWQRGNVTKLGNRNIQKLLTCLEAIGIQNRCFHKTYVHIYLDSRYCHFKPLTVTWS